MPHTAVQVVTLKAMSRISRSSHRETLMAVHVSIKIMLSCTSYLWALYALLYVTLNQSCIWCCTTYWTCRVCDLYHVGPVLYVMYITLRLCCIWCCTSHWTCPVCDVVHHTETV